MEALTVSKMPYSMSDEEFSPSSSFKGYDFINDFMRFGKAIILFNEIAKVI